MMSSIHRRHTTILGKVVVLVALSGAMAADALAFPIPQQAKGGSARTRCGQCSPTRDSLRAHSEQLLIKIDSLRYEFEHGRLSEAQRERLSEEMTRAVFALRVTLDQATQANVAVAAQAQAEAAREALRAMPEIAIAIEGGGQYKTRGYLGVVFDGTNEDRWKNNERIVRFYGYPRIAMVEPSSPAERAGILVGDTLLALNGMDVRQREISLTKLLIPDHRISVRVRRDGYAKDFRVTVGEAPAYVISRATPMPPIPQGMPGEELSRGRVQVQALPPQEPAIVRQPSMPSTPQGYGSVWLFQEGIAGAKVEPITEGLGRAVGVASGVLVIRAAPGTPAFQSGLRDGDVIVSAAGKSVTNVRQLRRVLDDQDSEDGVKLVIIRERKQRDVTLRWQ
jgi:membrane-associated protease RseP (regulator of RpoE activity)